MAIEAIVNGSDMQLVDEARSGSEKAFEDLMNQYMDRVYGIALQIVRNPSVAEDVTQEVFIIVYKQLNSFRGDSTFSTWLYRVTVNRALRSLKKEGRYQVIDDPVQLEQEEDTSPNPEAMAVDSQNHQILQKMISSLPDKQRTVLSLRVEQALPFKEIAKILGKSIGGVKANYFHAIQKLKSAQDGKEVLL